MLDLQLNRLPFFQQVKRFVVAYSGGLDSHVLLECMSQLQPTLEQREIIAVYVNHGLSQHSGQWSQHCAVQCDSLGVTFVDIAIDAIPEAGESPEAAARNARYRAFAEFLQAGDCLLTAHHQDDQAETLLLQLLRGAGPRGLAAMPQFTSFTPGWHARPLLGYSREALYRYSQQVGLSWINDESNSDTRYDRNFLRHEIFPLLKSRFPGVTATLSRSANLCAEAAELLETTAADDLSRVQLSDTSLSISELQILGEVRGRNLIHQWCRDRALPTPTAAQLQCVWDEVIGAAEDSEPVVSWPGGEVRRYRDALFLQTPLLPHDTGQRFSWDGRQPLEIPDLGLLMAEREKGKGVALSAVADKQLEIRFRQGGEQLRPEGRNGHHALKKLFQEAAVPPWLRERTPLLYADDQLLAVAGFWVAQEVAALVDEEGLCLCWSAQS